MPVLAVLTFALVGTPNSALKSGGRNGVADLIAEKSLAIGIDFDGKNPDAPRPERSEVKALEDAAPGAWLFAQIRTADDRIDDPSFGLAQWFESHRPALTAIASALEKDVPEWKSAGNGADEDSALPFEGILRLDKILLALALNEERLGDSIAAARALDASWSLQRAAASGRQRIDQIVAVGIERFHAGVLRKIKAPPLQWLGRFDSDGSWSRMIDAVASESRLARESTLDDFTDPWAEISRKLPRTLGEALRKRSPCEASFLTEDQVTRMVEDGLSAPSSDEFREGRRNALSTMVPSLLNDVHRAGRVAVDEEMTRKLLELRLEKAASREDQWPDTLALAVSAVCPEAAYLYRRDGRTMELRFEGAMEPPTSGGLVLPFVFRAAPPPGAATPTPAPTPVDPLTPTTPGGMISP